MFAFDGGLDPVDSGRERFVAFLSGFAQGFEIGRGAGVSGGIGKVFVEGCGHVTGERNCGFADSEVIDVIAQGGGEDEGFHGSSFGLFGDGFADLLDGVVCGVDWLVAQFFERDAETDGRIFQIEVDHVEIVLKALGQILRDAAEEVLVFAQAHGGDVRELIVFVNEGSVGEGGVTAAREHVEDGDGVARGEPTGDCDHERKGCIVAVRGENEDLQVAAPIMRL